MDLELTRVYYRKKKKVENLTTFDQIKGIEKRIRLDLVKMSDLLFKLQQNGESAKCVALTKSILMKTSDLVKTLKTVKSYIKKA